MPVCAHIDLYYEAGGYTGKVYHCKICGYIGALIVEADEEMARAIRRITSIRRRHEADPPSATEYRHEFIPHSSKVGMNLQFVVIMLVDWKETAESLYSLWDTSKEQPMPGQRLSEQSRRMGLCGTSAA